MTSSLLAESLSQGDHRLLQEFDALNTNNFVELGEFLGLDKSRGYRFINLAGTDFSNCDLRGYNFEGCDLRECYGRNVIWDHTTIIRGAEVGGSMFELASKVRESLQDPQVRAQLDSIRRAHWSTQAQWALQSYKLTGDESEKRRVVAFELFFASSDSVVKSSILQYLIFGAGAYGRIELLMTILSDVRSDTKSIQIALQSFGKALQRNPRVLNILCLMAEDKVLAPVTRLLSATLAVSNPFVVRNLDRAFALVDDFSDASLDNGLIRTFAMAVGPSYYLTVTGGSVFGGLDVRNIITYATTVDLARGITRKLRSDAAARIQPEPIYGNARDSEQVRNLVVDHLTRLEQLGLPLEFDDDV